MRVGTRRVGGFLVLLALSWLPPSVHSETPDTTQLDGGSGEALDVASAVRLRALATEVREYATEHESALGLILAIQMMDESDRVLGSSDGHARATGGSKGITEPEADQRSELLEQASAWARERPEVLAMVEGSKSIPRSLPTGRDHCRAGFADGKTVSSVSLSFPKDEPAVAYVESSMNTNLNCVVFDSNETEVARDFRVSRHCLLQWAPVRTDVFRIDIDNEGPKRNYYELCASAELSP